MAKGDQPRQRPGTCHMEVDGVPRVYLCRAETRESIQGPGKVSWIWGIRNWFRPLVGGGEPVRGLSDDSHHFKHRGDPGPHGPGTGNSQDFP